MRIAALLCVLMVMVGCSPQQDRTAVPPQTSARVAIFVYPNPAAAGQCAIRTFPQLIQVKRSDTVQWEPVNSCDNNVEEVEVTFNGGDAEVCDATVGRSKRCKIKGNAAEGKSYKYTVKYREASEDPEIEIVP